LYVQGCARGSGRLSGPCYPEGVNRAARVCGLGLLVSFLFAQTASLTDILSQELDRNFQTLREKADPVPYFVSYEVTEQEACSVVAAMGALQGSSCGHNRLLDVTVRVGSPQLDNYHRVQGQRPAFTSATPLPIEDGAGAIRQRLWLETDRVYRLAAERLIKLRTSTQVQVDRQEDSPDFAQEPPSTYAEPFKKHVFSPKEWESRARAWSAAFAGKPEILTSGVSVVARRETRYLVSTEGTRLVHGRGFARITLSAQARALDGMNLSVGETFDAEESSGLPNDKIILAAVERLSSQLQALRQAPAADPFVGPAILSGRAAGVLFHEIFGHRIEGHRQRDESEGQTFSKRLGTKVLPEFISVTFDPTRRRMDDVDLNGFYRYDDEGIAARPVRVVEAGVLKTFLLSRSPVSSTDKSNGHGRRSPGHEVLSRQSNLIVESTNPVPEAELRKMLREEVKRQDKQYGLYFQEVVGGYTQTQRAGLQAFTVIPIVVYRVYADGRPDELIRGVDIVGTPLASFEKILATSDRPEVFNGYCGAESGSVPVSAVSPALLVSEIETQRKQKSSDRPPLLPRPIPEMP
jgi:TldD protein